MCGNEITIRLIFKAFIEKNVYLYLLHLDFLTYFVVESYVMSFNSFVEGVRESTKLCRCESLKARNAEQRLWGTGARDRDGEEITAVGSRYYQHTKVGSRNVW